MAAAGTTAPVTRRREPRPPHSADRPRPSHVRALAGSLDLGQDESYALANSGSFQLSFFDHSPVAFWIAGLMQALCGRDISPILLRLPFVLMFTGLDLGASTASWHAAAFQSTAGLWAAGLLITAPFFFASAGSFVVPDGPLVLFLLFAAIALATILLDTSDDAHWRDWLLAGLAVGLALLSKYQEVLTLLGALIYHLAASSGNRRWLARPQPYVAALLALLVFAPVLIWNAENQWVSFAFQLGRELATRTPARASTLPSSLKSACSAKPSTSSLGRDHCADRCRRSSPVATLPPASVWRSLCQRSCCSTLPCSAAREAPACRTGRWPAGCSSFPCSARPWLMRARQRGHGRWRLPRSQPSSSSRWSVRSCSSRPTIASPIQAPKSTVVSSRPRAGPAACDGGFAQRGRSGSSSHFPRRHELARRGAPRRSASSRHRRQWCTATTRLQLRLPR